MRILEADVSHYRKTVYIPLLDRGDSEVMMVVMVVMVIVERSSCNGRLSL